MAAEATAHAEKWAPLTRASLTTRTGRAYERVMGRLLHPWWFQSLTAWPYRTGKDHPLGSG